MSGGMKIEKAAQIVTACLPLERDEVREAWAVIANVITEKAQSPECCRASLDFATYREKVRIDGR